MKKILLATDFSAASANAFRYCVALASELGLAIHVYHVYKLEQPIPESYLLYSTPDIWPAIREKLEKFIKSGGDTGSLSITVSGDHGIAADCILKEADRVAADLVVCGMQHASLDLRKIFGSTATAVAHKSSKPILIVPYNARFVRPAHIALACDTDPETKPETISLLTSLVQQFSADLSVVLITSDAPVAKYEMHFHKLPFMAALKELHPMFEFSQGQNITHSLLNFAREKKLDMLAVIAHKHSVFDRLVVESVTRNLAFHTDIPLLVLPQKAIRDLENVAPENQQNKSHTN